MTDGWVRLDDSVIDGADMADMAARAATGFAGLGVGPGDAVAWLLYNDAAVFTVTDAAGAGPASSCAPYILPRFVGSRAGRNHSRNPILLNEVAGNPRPRRPETTTWFGSGLKAGHAPRTRQGNSASSPHPPPIHARSVADTSPRFFRDGRQALTPRLGTRPPRTASHSSKILGRLANMEPCRAPPSGANPHASARQHPFTGFALSAPHDTTIRGCYQISANDGAIASGFVQDTKRHNQSINPHHPHSLPHGDVLYHQLQGSLMGISTFGPYRGSYPSRSPAIPDANPDESRMLDVPDGVQFFSDAPFPLQPQDINSSESVPDDDKRCLWVIRTLDVPFVREYASVSPPLQTGKCKHTNLTGGQDAHCGGEVWFISNQRLIINGGSGRYPPREHQELEEIVRAFETAGYEVWSMGWDSEVDRPARILRGSPPW